MDGRNLGRAAAKALRNFQQRATTGGNGGPGAGAGGGGGGSAGGPDLRSAFLGTGGIVLLGGGAILLNSALFNGAYHLTFSSSPRARPDFFSL